MTQKIYSRRKIWTQQPQQAVELDAKYGDGVFILPGGEHGPLAATHAIKGGGRGKEIVTPYSASAVYSASKGAVGLGSEWTIITLSKKLQQDAWARCVLGGYGSGQRFELLLHSDGRPYINVNGSLGVVNTYNTAEPTNPSDYQCRVFTRKAGVCSYWLNGVNHTITENNPGTVAATAAYPLIIGASAGSVAAVAVALVAVLPVGVAADNGKSLSANPWQIFRAPDSRIWIPSAGGGTSDALTASNINGSSTVGSPAIAQAHSLSVGAIIASSVVSAPSVTQKHAITASAIVASATVASPAITQKHALTAAAISASSTVGATTLTEIVSGVLSALPVAATPATVGAPAITQRHTLTASAIAAGPATFGTPTLAQQHVLMAQGITAGAAVVGDPVLSEGGLSPFTPEQLLYLGANYVTITNINDIAAAVLAAMQASPPPVNVTQFNGNPTTGTGRPGDPVTAV